MHPNTLVVSSATGFENDYRRSPYEGYGDLDNDELLFDMEVDESRPLKERVLAIRVGDAGVGFPFGELARGGASVAVNETVGGSPVTVFYEARDGETAVAYDPRVEGRTLTFDADPDGSWTDRETGSRWRIDGRATAGPLLGAQLDPRADAYVVYWFAWRHFQPEGTVWLH